MDVPGQNVLFVTEFTVGVGFTVIVKVRGVPGQVILLLVSTGVTVIVPVIGAVPVFAATKDAILPVPLGGRPMAGFEFVQL